MALTPKQHLREQGKEAEEKRRIEEKEKRQGLFSQLLDSYTANMTADGKRSVGSVECSLMRYVRKPFPELIEKRANEIEAEDIRLILATMIEKGITTHSNRVRSYLHAAFQHGLKQDHNPRHYTRESLRFNLKYNPVSFVPKQNDYERVGEHVIAESEIPIIWKDLAEESELAADAIKLGFALAGQRIGELLRVPRTDIDLEERVFLINQHISKNKKAHLLPLESLSIEIIEDLYRLAPDCKYLFPARRGSYIRDQHTTSTTISYSVRQFVTRCDEVKKFIPRDVRRTVKTYMGKAGISKSIRDRLQNHALQDVSTKHYDRYDYLPEKKEAMKIWNDYLERIIHPQEKGVNFIRPALS